MLDKAPPRWKGESFGPHGRRGWIKGVGSGRWADDWNAASVIALQDSADLHADAVSYEVTP